jgi:hypothetical protein
MERDICLACRFWIICLANALSDELFLGPDIRFLGSNVTGDSSKSVGESSPQLACHGT